MLHRVPPLIIVVFMALMIASYFFISKLLELPSNWLSFDGWQALPLWKKFALNLGAFFVSLIGSIGVYVAMVELKIGLPRPRTSIDAIQRAMYYGQKAQDEYLSKCKGTRMSIIANRLIEDMPSIVPPEEERRFFQENRYLNEAEVLLKQAIALEEQIPGRHQAYNIANAYNKLGYHYRFKRSWEKAIQCLEKSLSLFNRLRSQHIDDPAIPIETATTYFHLGQVYMARYRESNDPEDRKLAQMNFGNSIKIDQEIGHDHTATSQLLEQL